LAIERERAPCRPFEGEWIDGSISSKDLLDELRREERELLPTLLIEETSIEGLKRDPISKDMGGKGLDGGEEVFHLLLLPHIESIETAAICFLEESQFLF